jgi:WD40 repeat protein
VSTFKPHTNFITRIKQSPFNNAYVATTSCDYKVKIWNITSCNTNWTLIQTYENHTSYVYAVEYLTSDKIASCSFDNTIQIWYISTGLTSETINTGSQVFIIKLLSNGIYLAAGLGNGNITIYNINTGSLITTLIGHTGWVMDLLEINSDTLISTSFDRTVLIWNLTTNEIKFNLTGHSDFIFVLKLISTDILASGSWDKTVKLWNVTSGSLIRNLTHTNQVYRSVDLYNAQTLITGSFDQLINLWNFNTGQVLSTFNASLKIGFLAYINTETSKTFFLKFLL